MPTMRLAKTLLAASLAVLVAGNAQAEDSCAEDVKRLCGTVDPGNAG